MPIPVTCGGCGKAFHVGDEWAGRVGKCPGCGALITVSVPVIEVAEPPSAAAPVAEQPALPPPPPRAGMYSGPPPPPRWGYRGGFEWVAAARRYNEAGFRSLYGWFVGLFVTGIVCFIFAFVLAMGIEERRGDPDPGLIVLMLLLFLGGLAAMIVAVVFQCILLYRAWAVIQDGHARTTPGAAVGFCFVPFYNLYWMFQAIWGLSKDMNAFCQRHGVTRPPLPEGLALTYCILFIVSALPIPFVSWAIGLVELVMMFVLYAGFRDAAISILQRSQRT
ncbi:MAG: hypothetical protein FJ290_10020 [Planctomycetes bacterium]|nr:hypothetical protein [Planctomycetota bacterium]